MTCENNDNSNYIRFLITSFEAFQVLL